MELVALPCHGILGSLVFGHENYWDPEYMDDPPPSEDFDMSDAPPQWFEQANLATSVRFVASWKDCEPLTLLEIKKPSDANGRHWLANVVDNSGCSLCVEDWSALMAKLIVPSSVLPKVLGLPAYNHERRQRHWAETEPSPTLPSLSGAIFRTPAGWPEGWVDESDFDPHCKGGYFNETQNTCVAFSKELRCPAMISASVLPYWKHNGVAAWWEENMESAQGQALALGIKIDEVPGIPWPSPKISVSMWAIDEYGHTAWEAPSIPLGYRELDGTFQGSFSPLPCSLGIFDQPLPAHWAYAQCQTVICLHPETRVLMLAILPHNLNSSFGSAWQDYWFRRWSELLIFPHSAGGSGKNSSDQPVELLTVMQTNFDNKLSPSPPTDATLEGVLKQVEEIVIDCDKDARLILLQALEREAADKLNREIFPTLRDDYEKILRTKLARLHDMSHGLLMSDRIREVIDATLKACLADLMQDIRGRLHREQPTADVLPNIAQVKQKFHVEGEWVPLAGNLIKGTVVRVMQSLQSDDEEACTLEAGLQGGIAKTDEDGDISILFPDVGVHWICKASFQYLHMLDTSKKYEVTTS